MNLAGTSFHPPQANTIVMRTRFRNNALDFRVWHTGFTAFCFVFSYKNKPPQGPNRFGVTALPVDFPTAVRKFFTGYFDFNGRASRTEFWYAMLFYVLLLFVLARLNLPDLVVSILLVITMIPFFPSPHDACMTQTEVAGISSSRGSCLSARSLPCSGSMRNPTIKRKGSRMGKLVQLTICNSEVERTALLPFLKAYGIYATPPDQHAHNVSHSPAHRADFPFTLWIATLTTPGHFSLPRREQT
ncbi:DUF805 domain-containing protein [Ochrobactrum cytisi]|nr:DUF805 domain-containing protein [Brucella cytisi]